MNLTVSRTDLGTSEDRWLAHPPLVSCESLILPHTTGPVIVLAPHPDDEILAVGGLMRALAANGHPLHVVAVTDGEASHPGSRSMTREKLARRRNLEREEALAVMGLGAAKVTRMRFPDGAVGFVVDLDQMFAELLDDAALCIAPWDLDGHPDHDATGRAAVRACVARRIPLLQYPVWAWHWATPEGAELPWTRARRHGLEADLVARKREAIAAYRSQVSPLSDQDGDDVILPPAVLARFTRDFEIVFA